MSGVRTVMVVKADDGMRLDRWFRQNFPTVKHGEVQKMLRKGQIRVNGGRAQADRRVAEGEIIRVPPVDDERPAEAPPRPLSDEDREYAKSLVLYEDEDILALNKPSGLAVQGGAKQQQHIDGLLDAFATGNAQRPKLTHRLDRDTGGMLVLAKSRASAAEIGVAFRQHAVRKIYWAMTVGVPHPMSGRIDLAIEKRGAPGAERMKPGPDGKKALTDFQVVEVAGTKAAFVALRPTTGRTHQIRVHLSTIGAPIVGDRKYGGERAMLEGVAPQMHLFCRSMTLPRKGRRPLTLTAPLNDPMATTWDLFGFPQPDDLEWPDE